MEKGLAPLVLIVLVAAVVVLVVVLVRAGSVQLPSSVRVPGLTQQGKEPTVSLQTQYQNPFDGKFVNPFAGYKNPFDALK